MSKRSEWFWNGVAGLATLCAILAVGIRLRDEFAGPSAALRPETFPEWRDYEVGHIMGPRNAPVKVIEFADFQCPFCREAASALRDIRTKYPGQVAVVFRHFPLAIHEHALQAARASECAAAVGRFEALHDQLFAYADSIGKNPWAWFATKAGIGDIEFFEDCVNDTAPVRAIHRDTLAGERLGVPGTPTLLINETKFDGYPGVDALERYVEDAIRRVSQGGRR